MEANQVLIGNVPCRVWMFGYIETFYMGADGMKTVLSQLGFRFGHGEMPQRIVNMAIPYERMYVQKIQHDGPDPDLSGRCGFVGATA